MKKRLLLLIGCAVVLGGCLLQQVDNVPLPEFEEAVADKPNATSDGSNTSADTGQTDEDKGIRVTFPMPGTTIISPTLVTGEARGSWFFEASMPMHLEDENGTVIGESYLQAVGDWMSEDFVPFRGTMTFTASEIKTGYLVISADNPSGLAEHDAQVRVRVRFR